MKTALFAAFLLLSVSHAQAACLDGTQYTGTFFDALPGNQAGQSVVAKVEVLSNKIDFKTHNRVAQVRVVRGLRGVKNDDVFTVESSNSDCTRDSDIKPGDRYYIAGAMDKAGLFHGEWKDSDMPAPSEARQREIDAQRREYDHATTVHGTLPVNPSSVPVTQTQKVK